MDTLFLENMIPRVVRRLKREQREFRANAILQAQIADPALENQSELVIRVLEDIAATDAMYSDIINAVDTEINWEEFAEENGKEAVDVLFYSDGNLLATIGEKLFQAQEYCAENQAIEEAISGVANGFASSM